MTFNKKKNLLLLDVASCSIPLTTTPSPDEIQDKLLMGPNQISSQALFNYNIEALCGS